MTSRTIVAQATPVGPGAIALIRLSGKDAISIAAQGARLNAQQKLSEKKSHTISFGWVIDSEDKQIDQVLFLLMRAPQTFTGEDVVEITCHNNQLLVNTIIKRFIELGAHHAQRGEFTRQAVENNKLSLVQAEAIQELITAQNTLSVKNSLAQLEGSLSSWIKGLEEDLIHARALCEASFEFLEEEYEPKTDLFPIITKIEKRILEAEDVFSLQKQLKEGVRIALVGTPNVGKSSLLNALYKQDRAIVTPIPGTTRDTIEATIWRNTLPWTFVDTAGLRTTNDPIEKAGIQRTYEEIHKADIVIVLFDGNTQGDAAHNLYQEILNQYQEKCINVLNKIDLPLLHPMPIAMDISISTVTHQGLPELEKRINEHIKKMFPAIDLPFTLNQRHMHALTRIKKILEQVLEDLGKKVTNYELISLALQDALEACSEFSGQELSESLLDSVFSQFCVGK